MNKAQFWKPMQNGAVECELCPHRCIIPPGGVGYCVIRQNNGRRNTIANSADNLKPNSGDGLILNSSDDLILNSDDAPAVNENGNLITTAYARISGIALDPIEKKPLYRFHPGSYILSVGGFGCNMRCPFCQNHDIAAPPPNPGCTRADTDHAPDTAPLDPKHTRTHANRASEIAPPETISALAVQCAPRGNIGIAYTYNEPLINYEYIMDCAKAVRAAGLKNILVTNGLINAAPLEKLLPFIDAMNIDVKGFADDFYDRLTGRAINALTTVKETVAQAHCHCHVEVTTLVIPGENETHVAPLAKWLASIDPAIPLHLSRFFPRHRYTDKMPTPKETLYRLADIARQYLTHVFIGNI